MFSQRTAGSSVNSVPIIVNGQLFLQPNFQLNFSEYPQISKSS